MHQFAHYPRNAGYRSLLDEGKLIGRFQIICWQYASTDRRFGELLQDIIKGLEQPISFLAQGLWCDCLSRANDFAFSNSMEGNKYEHIAPLIEKIAEYGYTRSQCQSYAGIAHALESISRAGILIGTGILLMIYCALVMMLYAGDLLSGPAWVWDGFFGMSTWAKLRLFGLGAFILLLAPLVLRRRRKRIDWAHGKALIAWSDAEYPGAAALQMLAKIEGSQRVEEMAS